MVLPPGDGCRRGPNRPPAKGLTVRRRHAQVAIASFRGVRGGHHRTMASGTIVEVCLRRFRRRDIRTVGASRTSDRTTGRHRLWFRRLIRPTECRQSSRGSRCCTEPTCALEGHRRRPFALDRTRIARRRDAFARRIGFDAGSRPREFAEYRVSTRGIDSGGTGPFTMRRRCETLVCMSICRSPPGRGSPCRRPRAITRRECCGSEPAMRSPYSTDAGASTTPSSRELPGTAWRSTSVRTRPSIASRRSRSSSARGFARAIAWISSSRRRPSSACDRFAPSSASVRW